MHRRLRSLAFATAALSACAALALAMPLSPRSAGEGARHSTQGYLGVELRDPSSKDAPALPTGTARGTQIVRVDHDGPAGKAGLRENDLILQFDGQAIAGHEQLKHLLHNIPAGQTVSLLILRDGQQVTVTTQLEAREEVERRAWEQHIAAQANTAPDTSSTAPAPSGFLHGTPFSEASRHTHSILGTVLGAPYTGLALEPITPQLGEFFGVDGGSGLLVRSVDPNSPAMAAGIRAGDVILSVDQTTVSTESDWSRQMHESKGRSTPLLILRDHHQQTVSLTPDPKRKARLAVPERPGTLLPRRSITAAATSLALAASLDA